MDDSSNAFSTVPGVELSTVHGLPAVRVASGHATGLVYLQGAHVAAWQPEGHSPVIWMSPHAVYEAGKALRGGVPICWPWFGANSEHPDYPAHGFARSREFAYHGARIDEAGRTELELVLSSDEQTKALFPHAFELRLRVAFGSTLQLELEVENRGGQSFSFEEALHSYFAVSDVRQVALRGLQGARYADKVRNMARFDESSDELRITGETDRVYESTAACTIADPGAGRTLLVEKSSSASTVVWNPWAERAAQISDLGADAWPGMLCVESANIGGSKISLAPGEAHILRVTVSLTADVSPISGV